MAERIAGTEPIIRMDRFERELTKEPIQFPFRTVLSFHKLIEFWNSIDDDKECLTSVYARAVRDAFERTPELQGPIEDLSLVQKHGSIVEALMTPVFPPASWETDFSAAIIPFQFVSFYSSPRFERMKLFENGSITSRMSVDERTLTFGKVIGAYSWVLKKFYGIDVNMEYSLVCSIPDADTGLDRHYKWRMDGRFVDIILTGDLPVLREEDRKRLLSNLLDLNVWQELLPPGRFEFHGFTVFNAVDVTDQEVLSRLRFDLIEKDSILTPSGFNSLQENLRALLKRPDIRLGIAAMPGDKNLMLSYGRKFGESFLLNESCRDTCESLEGSAYDRALAGERLIVIDDLELHRNDSPVEERLHALGLRNLVIAPITYMGSVIGVLEIGSPHANDMNAITALKLKEILPLFGMAIKRATEELNNSVQAIIKERCTAIHPSVEWRFRHAAFNLIAKKATSEFAEMEPIVFEDVYPLYGLSDVRESSTLRNTAIQTDLIDQLSLAQGIVEEAARARPLPFLDELGFRITRHIEDVRSVLGSGDELTIITFLHLEVEPLFPTLRAFSPGVASAIDRYTGLLDPQLRVLYRKRKEFETSVTMLNEHISSYIDEQEEKAQEMFPHYFEKYKTDGVEHGMYVGASLVEDGRFDMMYLKNLRLWQLMTMCDVVRRAKLLKEKLPVPLDTAHLILVQDNPLSIRFRADEKKFDVDGAYNIRYEIMKKRIDKAMTRGRMERLTQPGKIAIVYSQPKEAAEYRRYIDYLIGNGSLTGEVEELELEELQGIQGLKALRVEVNTAVTLMSEDAGTTTSHAVRAFAGMVN